MKSKNNTDIVRTVPKYFRRIVETETKFIPVVTHIDMVDYISINRDGVTPVLWAYISPLSEILWSCKTLTSLPHRPLHSIGNWTPTYLFQINLISYM
jgi:hypothetical protein